jgi:hypothetical protein
MSKKKNSRSKKKNVLKRRNVLVPVMNERHSNGGSAGFHSKLGYSRKTKHRKTLE